MAHFFVLDLEFICDEESRRKRQKKKYCYFTWVSTKGNYLKKIIQTFQWRI